MTVTKGRKSGEAVPAMALTEEERGGQGPGLIGLTDEGDDGGTTALRERTPSVRLLGAPLQTHLMHSFR